ncbi:MAG TPA: high-affinity nickel-transport family protein [Patescibacteria group bacterium]|nr:high-affinity nickel-transport family protein [Patescibacteria group bacterium]
MSPLSILILGFLLGLKHATDTDHVVAVTAIVSRQKHLRHAAVIGAMWGIGHTAMIVLVGIAIIIFHLSIPDAAQRGFELLVAAALVVLGVLNLTGIHAHVHHHDDTAVRLLRPLVMGVIHGLAGSAAIALLILGSITDERLALMYLGIFGVGTIIGMMLITTLLGAPIIHGGKKFERFSATVTLLSGILSIVYGVYFGITIISAGQSASSSD